MRNSWKAIALAIAAFLVSTTIFAQSLPLRGPTPLTEVAPAPRMMPYKNTSEREIRNYPEQPPVIPHTIEGYQVDLNGNKCLACHARTRRARDASTCCTT